MSSITNSNDFKRGWEDGHNDALAGKDKNYIRMGASLKFAFHGSSALESYTDGYNKGYEVGITERNSVFKVETTNNKNMDQNSQNVQNFKREFEALVALNNFLVDKCCDRLMQVNGLFRGYITMMADTGVPVQECKEFADKYYVVDEQNLKTIYERIIGYDLPQIRNYIEQIARQFQRATGSDIGSINLKMPNQSVSSATPSNATSRTGGPQDYEKQLDAICDFMDFLVAQKNELHNTIHDYEIYCNNMISNGVPKQVVDHYLQHFVPENVRGINNAANNIQSIDYPQLKGLFGEISDSLNSLGKSYGRTPKSM